MNKDMYVDLLSCSYVSRAVPQMALHYFMWATTLVSNSKLLLFPLEMGSVSSLHVEEKLWNIKQIAFFLHTWLLCRFCSATALTGVSKGF